MARAQPRRSWWPRVPIRSFLRFPARSIRSDRLLTGAAVEGPHEIKLADRDGARSAKTILVATGSHPVIPEVPGKEHLISSNECFELQQLPERLVIIGAGSISMEVASIFR